MENKETNGDRTETIRKIMELLKERPEGLSINEISEQIGVHRHTVAKYVYFLEGAGEVFVRKVGAVSLIYHKKLRPTGTQKGQSRMFFSLGGAKDE